ncbi:T9SS type A sorting domain-containing protein, partial [Candidatus Fermentibacteria bacterium]|nr:T9SS type A sorting domain-containing protein [Candidatus Fermentibacteria bacterium]
LTVPFEARCRVSLYDLTGRVVLRETAIGPRVELEAPGLGAGIYMLGVTSDGRNLTGRVTVLPR